MKIAVVKVFEIFLFALTAIPVLLLPFVTSVPVAGWAALLGLDVFLVVLWRRCGKSKQPVRRVFTGFLAVFALAVAASQGFAATPPIIRENSIAALEKVRLGETDQWITIRGKDKSKPVLLYLGIGGPGAGGFPATQMNLKPLEDHFVVVNWDQPGTGKSYNAVEIKTLTVQKFIDDAHQLTVLLKERFQQEKIYEIGRAHV